MTFSWFETEQFGIKSRTISTMNTRVYYCSFLRPNKMVDYNITLKVSDGSEIFSFINKKKSRITLELKFKPTQHLGT